MRPGQGGNQLAFGAWQIVHPIGHGFSSSLCASAAVSDRPYTAFNCSILASVSGVKGALPSNACRAMPSTRSPSDTSRHSASPLRTFRRFRSIRIPVWTLSTVTMVAWYHDLPRPHEDGSSPDSTRRALANHGVDLGDLL